ncbi:MAG: hypothetical protein ACKVT1_14040 [Dehalococcoidia bacterium]
MPSAEQDEVDRCIDHVLVNPQPDGERIVELQFGRLRALAVICDELSILFAIERRVLWILSIERGIPHG